VRLSRFYGVLETTSFKNKKLRRIDMKEDKSHDVLDTVLNPRGQPTYDTKQLPMAPRLDTLDGKTVYLIDGKFGGSYELLQEMQRWFSKNFPSVKTVLIQKSGNYDVDDPELWAEIKEKGDGAVLGVGG
jgi:hypothetical protein